MICPHQSQPTGKDTGRRICAIGRSSGHPYLGECHQCISKGLNNIESVARFPTLPQMAGSLASSVTGWAKSGFKNATPEQLESRMEICKGCEFWDASGFAGTGRCQKCGCSTYAKLRMATSKCPIDKWGSVDVVKTD